MMDESGMGMIQRSDDRLRKSGGGRGAAGSSNKYFPSKVAVRGVALTYLALLLIIPLAVIFQDGLREGLGGLAEVLTRPVARHALWLSLWTSGLMALINAVMG